MSGEIGNPVSGRAVRDDNVLHLALLGRGRCWGERVVAFRTRKEFALLIYLAVARTPQPRERLATILWPDRDVASARNLLRTMLSLLRQHLAAAGSTSVEVITLLRAERDALGREVVGLARDGVPSLMVDVALLEAVATRKVAASDLEAPLQAAVSAYRGPSSKA